MKLGERSKEIDQIVDSCQTNLLVLNAAMKRQGLHNRDVAGKISIVNAVQFLCPWNFIRLLS